MIDIHNHLLMNVDDGPKSKEQVLALLKQAKSEGITGIIVTPHHLHPNNWSTSFKKVETLVKELLNDETVQKFNIKLYPGQEVRLSDTIFRDLKSEDIAGLDNSRYLLIELPSSRVPSSTKQILYELQLKGLIPIIAHPERNKEIAQDPEVLYELVQAGALSQITSSSLNGDLGKKVQKLSIQFIENNLAHFIASDAHDSNIRPFILNSLFKNRKLKKINDEIKELIKNGEKIILDENIIKHFPKKPDRPKKVLGIF